jgi:flagellar biosynthetic protein FliR
MTLASLASAKVAIFVLVVSRIAGFVVLSPFPGQTVGVRHRAALLCVLSWVGFSMAPAANASTAFDAGLVGAGIVELMCGLALGLAFRSLLFAGDVLGSLVGQMTGHASPTVLNPTLNAEETAVGRAVSLCALLVALAAGVHRIALASLLESFRALPVGAATVRTAGLMPLVDLQIDAFVVGVRLASPLIAVALLVQAGLGVVSRAAPSVQIFSVGFGVLFVSTTLVLIDTAGDMMGGLASHFGRLGGVVDALLSQAFR